MSDYRETIAEKAASIKQQRLMGMVRAVQTGRMKSPSETVSKLAASMKKKDVKDFASTKHEGLPKKKEEAQEGYSFEIGSGHKSAQKQAKIRNLAKGTNNPNEKSTALKKLSGPSLPLADEWDPEYVDEGVREKAKEVAKKIASKAKEAYKKERKFSKASPEAVDRLQRMNVHKQDKYGPSTLKQRLKTGAEHDIDKEREEKEKKKKEEVSEGKKGLWDNIHAKRKRGERPAKPGEKGYPKTLNVESAAWQRSEGKNKEGGLNEKGRKSYERENPGSDLKAPQPEGGPRKKSFCARMKGMKSKLTSSKTANDPDSRINKSLRKWKC